MNIRGNHAHVICCYASKTADELFYQESLYRLKRIKQQQVVYLPAGCAVPLSILTFVPNLTETKEWRETVLRSTVEIYRTVVV